MKLTIIGVIKKKKLRLSFQEHFCEGSGGFGCSCISLVFQVVLRYWQRWKLLACLYSVWLWLSWRHFGWGLFWECDVPSSVWDLEMLSLIFIRSLPNDQTQALATTWKPRTGFYVRKVSVDLIAALSSDFIPVLCSGRPLECGIWVSNSFCVITSHFYLPLWANKTRSLSKQNLISVLLRWLSLTIYWFHQCSKLSQVS